MRCDAMWAQKPSFASDKVGAACLQEKLCGERSPCAAAEVVDETDATPFQRHSGASRGDTHDWALQGACQQLE